MNEEQIRQARSNLKFVMRETKGNLAEAARRLGCSRQSIYKWLKMINSDDSLEMKKRGKAAGEIKVLTVKQSEKIRNIISFHDPEDAGIQSKLWSKHSVKKLIHAKYGKTFSPSTIDRLLDRWKFVPSDYHSRCIYYYFNVRSWNSNYVRDYKKMYGSKLENIFISLVEYARMNNRRPYFISARYNSDLNEILLYSFSPQKHYNFLITKRGHEWWQMSKDDKMNTHNAMTFLHRLQQQAKNRIVVGFAWNQIGTNDAFSYNKLEYLRVKQRKIRDKGLDVGNIEIFRIATRCEGMSI